MALPMMTAEGFVCPACGKLTDDYSVRRFAGKVYPAAVCRPCAYAYQHQRRTARTLDRLLHRPVGHRQLTTEEQRRETRRAEARRYREGRPEYYRRLALAYWTAHPEQRRAAYLTKRARRNGTLSLQPCVFCGTMRSIVAHHDDYSKPLAVRWMCRRHHRLLHLGTITYSDAWYSTVA
jgi:hypothetical protein